MALLQPHSEMNILQYYSVNKLLENLNCDLIFPIDIHGDNQSSLTSDSQKWSKLMRNNFVLDDLASPHNAEESSTASTTPSSVQSDYFSFPTSISSISQDSHNHLWHQSCGQNGYPSPPKRYYSDSNLNSNSLYNQKQHDGSHDSTLNCYNSSSPTQFHHNSNHNNINNCNISGGNNYGDCNERSSPLEKSHYDSSLNVNYNNSNMDQLADVSNLFAINSLNNADYYMSKMKGFEQTMRMFQQPGQPKLDQQYKTTPMSSSCGSMGSLYFSNNPCNYKSTAKSKTSSSCVSITASDHRYGHMGGGSSSSSLDDPSSLEHNSIRTWNGIIPSRGVSKVVTYSQKVFLGGIPWDTSEEALRHIFGRFGPLRIEWPGKDNYTTKPKGCVYVIFENEKQVRDLLNSCQFVRDRNMSGDDGKYFFKFPWKNLKTKNVEIIPWNISDSNYVSTSQILDPSKTIFVGALHGKLTAEGLALIMNDLFDGVVYAGIDTDKHKYPLGAGRVTFNNAASYMKAITTAYIIIKTPMFTKKVQIDPYLEDSLCSSCNIQHGPYYCRELVCFRYYCRVCWQLQHKDPSRNHHRPLTRNSKSQSIVMVE